MAVRGSTGRERHSGTVDLALSAAGWSISFIGCPDVVTDLEAILHGWGLTRNAGGPPDAAIVKTDRGYGWESAKRSKPVLWDTRPPETTMNVISDVHDVLFDWYLADHPDLLCLHAGAVDFGPGLVCFPSVRKAGKSTLGVALASRRFCSYCDDVLPVEPHRLVGIAMGIAPLLRKPLPASLGEDLSAFIAKHAGPSNENRTYVCLGAEHAAPFGRRKPIQALVLLDRREAARASLEPIAKAEMMREVVMQNFGARSSPTLVLDSFAKLIETRNCFRMIFADVMEAADLLGEQFA
jgi:hypothetical protein